jgi:hypothetical protein
MNSPKKPVVSSPEKRGGITTNKQSAVTAAGYGVNRALGLNNVPGNPAQPEPVDANSKTPTVESQEATLSSTSTTQKAKNSGKSLLFINPADKSSSDSVQPTNNGPSSTPQLGALLSTAANVKLVISPITLPLPAGNNPYSARPPALNPVSSLPLSEKAEITEITEIVAAATTTITAAAAYQ